MDVKVLILHPYIHGYVEDLSLRVSGRSIVSISYFGPLTCFIYLEEPTAVTWVEALPARGDAKTHFFVFGFPYVATRRMTPTLQSPHILIRRFLPLTGLFHGHGLLK